MVGEGGGTYVDHLLGEVRLPLRVEDGYLAIFYSPLQWSKVTAVLDLEWPLGNNLVDLLRQAREGSLALLLSKR